MRQGILPSANKDQQSIQGPTFKDYLFSFDRNAIASKALGAAALMALGGFMTILMRDTDSQGHRVTPHDNAGIVHEPAPNPEKWLLHLRDPADLVSLEACVICVVVASLASAVHGSKYVENFRQEAKS